MAAASLVARPAADRESLSRRETFKVDKTTTPGGVCNMSLDSLERKTLGGGDLSVRTLRNRSYPQMRLMSDGQAGRSRQSGDKKKNGIRDKRERGKILCVARLSYFNYHLEMVQHK